MTKQHRPTEDHEKRKQNRLHKIGSNNPRCATCGNNDWRVLEEHHPGARKRDKLVVLLCANHHRIVTDDQKDHPKDHPNVDEFLARVGNFLLGLADMLRLVLDRLYEFGEELIVRANSNVSVPEVRS
jgi:hypothetical protein